MPDWISWGEAVAVVALHFPPERAEGLLHAAVIRGGSIEVRAIDQGHTTEPLGVGHYVLDNPDYPYSLGEARQYFKIEDVDLQTLKVWLAGLTSGSVPREARESAEQPQGSRRVVPQGATAAQADRLKGDLRSANAGLPARKRGPKPVKKEGVKVAMLKFTKAELEGMTEETMVAHFGPSRETCRKARNEILANYNN